MDNESLFFVAEFVSKKSISNEKRRATKNNTKST